MSIPRDDVLAIYRSALAAVHGKSCVEQFLSVRRLVGAVYVVAVGKAADAMLQGAYTALGGQVRAALLITKPGHVTATNDIPGISIIEAGHPVPDEGSLRAGQEMLNFISATPNDAQLLFLISGGTSALVEVLPDGVDLDDLQLANKWLLASGLDIYNMNVIRKRLSRIKGGLLAEYLHGRRVLQLLLSDVPGDNPADIGSGLLVQDNDVSSLPSGIPAWLKTKLNHHQPSVIEHTKFIGIETYITASLSNALDAAAEQSKRLGYKVRLHADRINGDAAQVGRRLATELIDQLPCMHLWGGESSVKLPPNPGRGGRNQQLALAAAEVIDGHNNIWLLAAGTDGSDGPGGDAGALVDGGTILRGTEQGMKSADCLSRADAGSFLEKSGDLVNTGPTGTNVMDIMIGFKS